ncbi:MAG TPA: beta-ketoacyl-[acyl-carrier-protein] synthase family protein [Myxococcaceae bacterium]|jgi:3-oxoacyl-[acyl-carrier-protein] synthase II
MRSSDDEVVFTGMGQISALGRGCTSLWEAIREGRDGLRPVQRFPLPAGGPSLAGLVPGHDGPLPDAEPPYLDLFRRFALDAAREAIDQARAGDLLGAAPSRAALVIGTNTLFDTVPPQELASAVATGLGIRGPQICVGTACSASTLAIGLGRDLLDCGAADLVLAGGTDVLSPDVFAGFHALGLLSPGRCAPFSDPRGTVLAEGAGFVVLERRRHAEGRGAAPLASLLGYGLSDDAYHETTPDPAGGGVARAVSAALLDAGLSPEAIGYVNAHATGTEANDAAEWRGLGQALGDRLARVPVSASKSFLGHAQGSAGVLELIASLLALRSQAVPPTLHFTSPRPGCPSDPVAASAPRPHRYQAGLSTNSAFAGANAAVVFALPDQHRGPRPAPRPVFVHGAGAVGPHGVGLSALRGHLERGAPGRPEVKPFALEELVPSADPRRLDPSSRFLAAAVASALGEAKLQVHGALRARSGLMVGSSRVSPETSEALLESVRTRGLWKLSSAAFARRVLGAPAGACARLLSLRGPTGTLATGAGASLVAVACGAHHLATRNDVEVLVAGGFDERGAAAGGGEGEGAGCVVLASGPGSGPAVRLAGWALAGSGDAAAAMKEALARAGVDAPDVELVFGREEGVPRSLDRARRVDPEAVLGRSDSAGPALGLAAAYAAVRDGAARTAAVFSSGGSAACAVLLQRCS